MSGFRAGELGPISGIRRKAKAHQDALLTRLRSEVVAGTAENGELLAELEKAICRIETLTKERDDLAKRNELLHDELKTQKANWATYEQFRDQADAEQDIAPDSATGIREFANAHEAYQRAKADFSGPLLFLESAEESVKNSPFKNTRRLYETLEALWLVATQWKESEGRLGKSFKDALKEEGVDVHPVSQTSKGKWEDDYRFVYKGRRLFFEEHTTIGAGQPDKCLSIHWYRDESDFVLVIGHCGRHLANTKA